MRGRWLLLALLLLAAALRFHRIDAQSFWNDEGNSARLSERSLALIIEGTASDVHPPLYYLLLRGWRELAGASEFSLRALSAFAGILAVAATAALARRWQRRPAAAAATTLFMALSPPLVYYSQEARMYELLALLAALATLLLVALLPHLRGGQPATARRTALPAALYLLAVAAGLYTHYFFPAVLAVHGLVVAVSLDRRHWRGAVAWAALAALAVLLYLPWLPIFLRQTGGRPGDELSLVAFGGEVIRWLALGPAAAAARWAVPLVLVGAVLALLPWPATERRSARRAWLALAGVLLPLLLMWLVQATRPAFYKFLVVAVPFLALLWGQGAARLAALPGRGRLLALALVVAFVGGSGLALANLYTNPAYARADYRGMAARIATAGRPNAGIILNAANQWEVFTYYHRDGAPVYPIPRGAPDPDAIAAELAEIAGRHDHLYAIFWGEAERDPERLVERWLDAHAYKATDEWVGDVRFVVYAVPGEAAMEMETPAGATFGEQITLLGYTLRGEQRAPGDIIEVTLFWEAAQPLAERYKVFLHLVEDAGVPVAQRDSEPGGGLALTTTWQPGETVIDNHGVLVPPGTAPGEYRLLLGLYPFADPARRLPLAGGEDSYLLATITVRE